MAEAEAVAQDAPVDVVALATGIMHEANEGPEPLAFLRTGVHHTNRATAGYDHFMALVPGADHIRLLSYPRHPTTGRRMDVSYVPLELAKHVVGLGHENNPMRYRFLDHLRSAEVLDDAGGVAAKLVAGAAKRLSNRQLHGDYVHSQSAFIEDLWGELERGKHHVAWAVCRDVANGCLGMLLEEATGDVPMRSEFANHAAQQGPEFQHLYERFYAVPDDAVQQLERMLDIAEARENRDFDHDQDYGSAERGLLAEVGVLAQSLVDRYGEDVRAVGATGSIGRNSATADADYDVHVLIRPRHPDDAHRIDFRLYVPTYPGLPRRAEVGFTSTTFMETLLEAGMHQEFSYYHLDHVRNTALVYDPQDEGADVGRRARAMRPKDEVIADAVRQLREVLVLESRMEGPARADFLMWLADEVARVLLMRYGLGYMKPKYRVLTMDRIRPFEPEFFAAYDRVLGLDTLTPEQALDGARAATALFDLTMARLGTDYLYRCEEMQLA